MMNTRKREALFLLTVTLSCAFVLFLVVIKNHSSYLAVSSRSSRPWDDDDWYWSESELLSYSYSGSVIYPRPTPDVDPTCLALQQLAGSTGVCTPNDQCNGVHCTVTSLGSFDLTVEPCHNPPAIDVVGRNGTGSVVFNQTLTTTRREPLGLGTTLDVNVQQSPSEDSITISVTVHAGSILIPLIPESTIPLNREQCDFIPHTPTPSQPTPTPSHFPTPTPGVDPTCQVLQQLASTYPVCSTSPQCSGIHCGVSTYGSFDLTVEPCHNPPAVDVVGRDSSGSIVFNRTLTETRQEPLGLGTTLDINITQSPSDDSISISVSYSILSSISIPIIPETRIPLNREQCGFTPGPPSSHSTATLSHSTATLSHSTATLSHSTATLSHSSTNLSQPSTSTPTSIFPSRLPPPPISTSMPVAHTVTEYSHSLTNSSVMIAPPSTPPSGTGTSLTVAVAVPVSIILCLVGGVVLVVAIVLVVRRHKRIRREYHFQRMTFSDDRDDDDDEDL